jgi:hypothetical protein
MRSRAVAKCDLCNDTAVVIDVMALKRVDCPRCADPPATLKRHATCDLCGKSAPGKHTVAYGIETFVCYPCLDPSDPDPYGEIAEAREEAKRERDSYTTSNCTEWS